MSQRKRKHHEFAKDTLELSEGTAGSTAHVHDSHPAEMASQKEDPIKSQTTLPERALNNDTTQDRNWAVSLSKKARKKKKKQEREAEEDSMEPSLYFHNKIVKPLRIKDLQGLILYALSDGIAPTWVAVKNAKQIHQVAVLMVPGMDKEVLSALTSSVHEHVKAESEAPKDTQSTNGLTPPEDVTANWDAEQAETPQARRSGPTSPPNSPLNDCIVPVKAPGDSRSGRIHSPLQAMLISPAPKENSGRNGADLAFEPVPTPISQFVHSADELVEAQYPVHPAIFTDQNDAQLEMDRRESVGQSSAGGWVDTEVASSEPVPAQKPSKHELFTQGMQVYAVDCEMVLTTDDVYSLARISILDWHGAVVLDKVVRPALAIKDYFTQFSGITEKLLEGVTTTLEDIQRELRSLCGSSTILLGHSLESDFNALKMTHPFIVDTSMLYPHPRGLPLRSSLKFLANKYLKREIQKGGESGHDSVEDARAVLDLVKLKCEKGPKWGTVDANGESIFARLNTSGRRTAIVECGTPEKVLGRLATIHVGCQNDAEVTDGIVRLMSTQGGAEKVNFVWGRLREMEMARGWNSSREQYTAPSTVRNEGHAGGPANGSKDQESETSEANRQDNGDSRTALEKAADDTVGNLVRIYDSLAPSTLLVVFSGPGDMREVLRLQAMQKQYKKEFKVKKWDELSVKWTDDEVQALRKAFDEARKGWGLVCLK